MSSNEPKKAKKVSVLISLLHGILSMHHNQTSLLIHVALGYHFMSLLLFFCEVTAV